MKDKDKIDKAIQADMDKAARSIDIDNIYQSSQKLVFDYEFTPKQLEFLVNFVAMRFHITKVCLKVGISRRAFYNWCNETPGFKETIEDLEEGLIDSAIDCLERAMELGDSKSAQFLLKFKGKKRGFNESLDITSNGNTIAPIQINIMPPSTEDDE